MDAAAVNGDAVETLNLRDDRFRVLDGDAWLVDQEHDELLEAVLPISEWLAGPFSALPWPTRNALVDKLNELNPSSPSKTCSSASSSSTSLNSMTMTRHRVINQGTIERPRGPHRPLMRDPSATITKQSLRHSRYVNGNHHRPRDLLTSSSEEQLLSPYGLGQNGDMCNNDSRSVEDLCDQFNASINLIDLNTSIALSDDESRAFLNGNPNNNDFMYFREVARQQQESLSGPRRYIVPPSGPPPPTNGMHLNHIPKNATITVKQKRALNCGTITKRSKLPLASSHQLHNQQ